MNRYKKIKWRTPNKMEIATGHATFDRQTNIISDGNSIANTMIGWHIRSRSETECNGFTSPPGHLRDFDLAPFRSRNMSRHVLKYVLSVTEKSPIWLYEFFHYNSNRRVTHGYVIVAKNGMLMHKFVTGPTYKSWNIIEECAKYVSREKAIA